MRRIFCGVGLLLLPLVVFGATDIQKKIKGAQRGEEAVYLVEIESNLGKNKTLMTFRVVRADFLKVKILKILEWKGRKKKKSVVISKGRTLIGLLRRNLEQSWDSVQITTKLSQKSQRISMKKEVKVFHHTKKQGKPVPQAGKRKFSCYKLTLDANGKYPRAKDLPYPTKPYPAEMKMVYWISPEVPVFGWVKAEGTITRTLRGKKVEGKIRITLIQYTKVQQ